MNSALRLLCRGILSTALVSVAGCESTGSSSSVGVSYGYGTDTQWPPKETLVDELRALSLVFSPTDIVQIITKNAAISTLHGTEIGTLEPGKLADIVIVDILGQNSSEIIGWRVVLDSLWHNGSPKIDDAQLLQV